jgi:hypothetical protein
MLSTVLISAALMSVRPLKLPFPKLSDSSSNTFVSRSRACTINNAGFDDGDGNICGPKDGDRVDADEEEDLTICGVGAKVEEFENVGAG